MSFPDVNYTLAPIVERLRHRHDIDSDDAAAILELPHTVRIMRPSDFIVREGDKPTRSCVILAGFAFRQKLAGDGARQILSIHLKGDIVDLQNSLLDYADHNVQAMTHVEAAFIPVSEIRRIAASRPAIGAALWYETLVEASISREWTLNVGRRDARTRAAHLLCEFGARLAAAGLCERASFELPMTQEQFGDALGLTSVHVNRTLKRLAMDGLIQRTSRSVRVADWTRLAEAGDFEESYLHLQRTKALTDA